MRKAFSILSGVDGVLRMLGVMSTPDAYRNDVRYNSIKGLNRSPSRSERCLNTSAYASFCAVSDAISSFILESYYATAYVSSGRLLPPDVLPALPSKTNGPAVFVGVIGPSPTSISMVGVCELVLRGSSSSMSA